MELRVFISSTCEDLGQVRADLSEACRRAGWIPVLCEEGSVTYEREVEDSCYDEVQNCPVLISIIGRRWGTPSVHDRNISISQGEFNAAMAKKKKVYVFIKPDVFYEYKTYSKNRDNPRYTPCSVDDIRTFSFIEDIYNSKDENVVINPFLSVSKIMDYLKKQFGGIVENALEHKSEKVELKSNSLWPHNMKIFTGLYDKIGNVEIK
ncbi:MAG: DUF4062 domain-containing protein, partial [Tannerella sp.]|nr:DUF4062 domain-containing protein [Tannerella sp.]